LRGCYTTDSEKVKSGLGEFWDNWIEEDKKETQEIQELIKKREQEAVDRCIEEAYMDNKLYDEMTSRYNFTLTEPMRIALGRLEGIKVDQ
jgi:hypothetical protein